jgi:hypothetical protein
VAFEVYGTPPQIFTVHLVQNTTNGLYGGSTIGTLTNPNDCTTGAQVNVVDWHFDPTLPHGGDTNGWMWFDGFLT